ncbi:hypothetical protein APHAL10511_007940 [Amanita phalloides]|nr:hypothetical protein APHAL10511_007940 [Amanita phalloides]
MVNNAWANLCDWDPLLLEGGASIFITGEYILVKIPEEIQVEGYVDNEATAVGTDLLQMDQALSTLPSDPPVRWFLHA